MLRYAWRQDFGVGVPARLIFPGPDPALVYHQLHEHFFSLIRFSQKTLCLEGAVSAKDKSI